MAKDFCIKTIFLIYLVGCDSSGLQSSAFRGPRQEKCKFETSLGYIGRACIKAQKNKNKNKNLDRKMPTLHLLETPIYKPSMVTLGLSNKTSVAFQSPPFGVPSRGCASVSNHPCMRVAASQLICLPWSLTEPDPACPICEEENLTIYSRPWGKLGTMVGAIFSFLLRTLQAGQHLLFTLKAQLSP